MQRNGRSLEAEAGEIIRVALDEEDRNEATQARFDVEKTRIGEGGVLAAGRDRL